MDKHGEERCSNDKTSVGKSKKKKSKYYFSILQGVMVKVKYSVSVSVSIVKLKYLLSKTVALVHP